MLKPIPEEFVDEDQYLLQLMREKKAYDHVDELVREYASKEYAEWFFAENQALRKMENRGFIY